VPSSASFADRIVNIAVTGPMIRIELGTLVLPTEEGATQKLVPSQTLVMPLDGFLVSFGMLESVVRKLVADGVVKPRPLEDAATTGETPQTRQ
jgi:hypothetical protein